MTDLSIEYLPTSVFRPWERNARTHSKKQIRRRAFAMASGEMSEDEYVAFARAEAEQLGCGLIGRAEQAEAAE